MNANRLGYRVTRVTATSGVRIPILVEGELGIPTFDAAVYAGQQLRHPDRSPNSDAQVLTSVACWVDYKARRAIDWADRVLTRKFLLAHEIHDYVRHLYVPRCGTPGSVSAGTVATRIDCVIPYIAWEIERITSLDWRSAEHFEMTQVAATAFLLRLGQARPRCDRPSEPRSLTPEQSVALHGLLHPADGIGIWRDEFIAGRNACFHDWEDETGHRVGELLGIRLQAIDFERLTYRVERGTDGTADWRAVPPRVKGYDRELDMSPRLASRTMDYVTRHRCGRALAADHNWLFVSSEGRPWSVGGVQKMCARLRAASPDLLGDYTSHVERHSWNDRFSEEADRMGIGEEAETRARALAMGWRSAGTARTYTKRHDRRRAHEVSMRMQERVMRKRGGIDE